MIRRTRATHTDNTTSRRLEEQVDDDAADDLSLQEVLQAQPESGHADEELRKVPERGIDQPAHTLSEIRGERVSGLPDVERRRDHGDHTAKEQERGAIAGEPVHEERRRDGEQQNP